MAYDGRQSVIMALHTIPYSELPASDSAVTNIKLPAGAFLVSGTLLSDLNVGVTSVELTLVDADGANLGTLIAAESYTTGRNELDVSGFTEVISVPSSVRVDVAGTPTSGSLVIALSYAKLGRSEFTQD